MKRIQIILLITLFFGGEELCFPQNYSYGYDASGNRVSRTVQLLKYTGSGDEKDKAAEYSEKLEDLEIYLYPNPTRGEIRVRLKNLDEAKPSVIYLYDNSGRLLNTRTNLQEINLFDLSGFSRGIYLLKIIAGEQKTEWKIIKE
jgi:hypothetical protein